MEPDTPSEQAHAGAGRTGSTSGKGNHDDEDGVSLRWLDVLWVMTLLEFAPWGSSSFQKGGYLGITEQSSPFHGSQMPPAELTKTKFCRK